MIVSHYSEDYRVRYPSEQFEVVITFKARGFLPNEKQLKQIANAGVTILVRDRAQETPGNAGSCWIGLREIEFDE